MFSQLRRMTHNGLLGCSTVAGGSYEEALKTLCLTMQSNTAYLRSVENKNDVEKLKATEKYLFRAGITMEQLDNLSVIHVSGTKGKGSTCAFTENILRHHGFSTGFFSSPHLVSVRERIRLNGEPISQSHFTHFFWNVYRNLEQKREYESDMPTFFMFLTILMFHVFLEAKVDVAIVEVGIGGELDSTNIIRNPVCVGVTSLGLDHTDLLGNTLEEIAYQKSGIFKPHAAVFTVPQSESAMRVLQKRAVERQCNSFQIVPVIQECEWNDAFSSIRPNVSDAQRENASLSINMAFEWIKSRSNGQLPFFINNNITDFCSTKNDLRQIISLSKVTTALANCKWPGRTQILKTSTADFFVDGAHTVESMINCISWFQRTSRKACRKILIFNTSGNRNSLELLTLLKPLDFDRVYFVPNCAGIFSVEDLNLINYEKLIDEQKTKCKKHCEFWGEDSVLKNSVAEVLFDIKRYALSQMASDDKVEILVTGSLHLVGALFTVLDPDLTMTCKF
ncbi:folylpolyglutamate synthase, mitochondrial-like isoform X1 [Pseudomyrmex gracilis]|uniref:folylpolyglutamate synthase, mitochondrial-like isoform X1 n=1 Tax=Pseudomyrmex gracilis TaxID=219809 RepID=UPI0009957576|nr:folylpolyglutamate synthase, mitochondrial-like isoform X1 [Pseudomyrmex gracilis]